MDFLHASLTEYDGESALDRLRTIAASMGYEVTEVQIIQGGARYVVTVDKPGATWKQALQDFRLALDAHRRVAFLLAVPDVIADAEPWWGALKKGHQVKATAAAGCSVYLADRVALWRDGAGNPRLATWVMTLEADAERDSAGKLTGWLRVAASPELWVKAGDVGRA